MLRTALRARRLHVPASGTLSILPVLPSIRSFVRLPAARAPPPAPPVRSRAPRYRALYDFATVEQGELPLVQGDVVELEEKEASGWWLVKKNGTSGWAPADYLELVQDAPKPPPPVAPKPKPSAASAKPAERPTWSAPDSNATPVAVMPGMGEPGGFAAVLARKKAEAAAAAQNQGM